MYNGDAGKACTSGNWPAHLSQRLKALTYLTVVEVALKDITISGEFYANSCKCRASTFFTSFQIPAFNTSK